MKRPVPKRLDRRRLRLLFAALALFLVLSGCAQSSARPSPSAGPATPRPSAVKTAVQPPADRHVTYGEDQCREKLVRLSGDESLTLIGSYDDMGIYIFSGNTGSYEILAQGGLVTRVNRSDAADRPYRAVTSQQLLERAKEEVRKYAPAFEPDEMELTIPKAEPGVYQYYWQAVIDGVRTGNSVFVGLNGQGALCYLVCQYNLDAQPDLGSVRITEHQAREAAISFARLAPGQQINILLPIRVRECYLTYHPYFPDRLAWYVACDIQIYGGWQDSYWCYIDAASGDKNYDPYDPPIPRPVSG